MGRSCALFRACVDAVKKTLAHQSEREVSSASRAPRTSCLPLSTCAVCMCLNATHRRERRRWGYRACRRSYMTLGVGKQSVVVTPRGERAWRGDTTMKHGLVVWVVVLASIVHVAHSVAAQPTGE